MPRAYPALVDKAYLISLSRGKLVDSASLDIAIEVLSAQIRQVCGWHISPVITETRKLDFQGGRLLRLPTLKLQSIESISIRGVPWDRASTADFSENGYLRIQPFVRRGYGIISATFTHGYPEGESGLEALMAAWLIRSQLPIGITGETTGATSWQFGAGHSGLSLSASDEARLAPYSLEARP